jgi:hypothetical protein
MSKSYEYHSAAGSLPVEVSSEGVGNNTQATVKALGPSDFEEENRSSEQPKLNLKPRSLSVEQLEASNEKDRLAFTFRYHYLVRYTNQWNDSIECSSMPKFAYLEQ